MPKGGTYQCILSAYKFDMLRIAWQILPFPLASGAYKLGTIWKSYGCEEAHRRSDVDAPDIIAHTAGDDTKMLIDVSMELVATLRARSTFWEEEFGKTDNANADPLIHLLLSSLLTPYYRNSNYGQHSSKD